MRGIVSLFGVSSIRLTVFGIAAVAALVLLPPAAVAGMVSTEAVAGAVAADSAAGLADDSPIGRAAISAGLVEMGLSPAEAEARVRALSDAELLELSGRLADVPAGGEMNWYLLPEILISLVLIIVIVSA